MTGPALDPELAAAYVRELSADVTAVVVLDGEGRLLAGPEDLAARARELAAGGAHPWVAADGAHTVVAFADVEASGPTALDLETALQALKSAT
jgi:hypothetical protein